MAGYVRSAAKRIPFEVWALDARTTQLFDILDVGLIIGHEDADAAVLASFST